MLLILFAVLLVLTLAVVPVPQLLPTAHADPGPCAAQKAALDADNQAIEEHNSRQAPGGSAPPQIAIPYNQEAATLDAKAAADLAKLQSCAAAVSKIKGKGPLPPPMPDKIRDALDQARRNAPPGWRASNQLPRNPLNKTEVVVPRDSPARPVYDAVRGKTPQDPFPNVPLQGKPRPHVGEASPALPGEVIGKNGDGTPAVSADHIVPLAELVQLPRFMELNPDNMWLLINAPLNLQWLDTLVNRKKGSRSISDMTGVDPAWQTEQAQLQDGIRRELIDLIAQLADSQID